MTTNNRFYHTKEFWYITAIVLLFVAISLISQIMSDELTVVISGNAVWSRILYVLLLTAEVVAAPVSVLPIIPLAVRLFGSFEAALLTTIAWIAGSQLAFIIARTGGQALLQRLVNQQKLEKLNNSFNSKNVFFSLVFIRLAFPVDIVSYAAGLFTAISWWAFLLASIIGITPYAFLYSYAATLPFGYQLLLGALALMVLAFGYRHIQRKVTKS